MNKLLLVIFLLMFILPATVVYGEEQNTNDDHPIDADSRALQFQIGGNFTLSSFSGSAISYKRHVSDERARRVGISFNNGYAWQERSEDGMNERDRTQLSLGVDIDYTWMNYLTPESSISFYYGYGPGISLDYDRSEQELGSRVDETEEFIMGVSAIGYAGVEWFFHSSMGLHAEYGASIRFSHRSREVTRTDNDDLPSESVSERSTSQIFFGGDGVRFGLSVYF